jgi:hypothetical protein
VAAPMFHKKSLDEMMVEFKEMAKEVLGVLETHVDSDKPIDIQTLFLR